MRRLFIIRKDLHMSPGKLAAQVGHCAEAYWANIIRNSIKEYSEWSQAYEVKFMIDKNLYDDYLNSIFTKTICEAKNKNHLLKARDKAIELGLEDGVTFGLIYDKCLTELEPEEDDGTTLTGIWFAPLNDEIAHEISKKYQLYK